MVRDELFHCIIFAEVLFWFLFSFWLPLSKQENIMLWIKKKLLLFCHVFRMLKNFLVMGKTILHSKWQIFCMDTISYHLLSVVCCDHMPAGVQEDRKNKNTFFRFFSSQISNSQAPGATKIPRTWKRVLLRLCRPQMCWTLGALGSSRW